MTDIIFKAKHILFRIAYFIIHSIFVFFYRGRKQTVPPIKNALLLKSACKLAEEIREGKVKSEEVVQAYINRILEVEPYLNAVVQDRFKEALEEAKEVDKTMQEVIHSETFSKEQLANEKPFFGVPFTIKLLIKVKGLPCTAASRVFENQISAEDARCVELVKKAGGIILANTNTPEFGLSLECINLLYGKTSNPYDTTRTAGGSSGGETALLGAGASVVGIGNDLIGSVRVPAHFTGVFGHKPSVGLISNAGNFPAAHPDQTSFVYNGPMCRYSEDLAALMKILSEDNTVAKKFGQKVNFQKLKIYYSTSVKDPKLPPVDKEIVSSILRAVSYFSTKYNVVSKEIGIPLLDKSEEISMHFLTAPISNLTKFITLGKMDHLCIPLDFFKCLFGKSTFSFSTLLVLLMHSYPYPVHHKNCSPYYEKIIHKVKKELDELLDENSIFIYPTYPITAPYHYEVNTTLALSAAFTAIFNFTGHPATQCPLGLNKEGLPFGLQIIGGMNNDPLTIACAAELEKVFGGWIPPK